ncbi:MAG TPA: hypothetical protein VMU21_01180 [Thermodesulfovibrionales bacterium]|nr:hypothetical protein [Thermodesulfovibrionales bacterium]
MRIFWSFAGIMVACMCQWLFLSSAALAADECEVVKASYYERTQGEIVTDWSGGYAYRRYQTVVYPCADVTVRDTYGSAFIRVVEITATFSDQGKASKKAWCDKKTLENDVTYFCIVCFENEFPVTNVACNFR